MFAEHAKRMTVEEFLAWEEKQEIKYELIDGFARPRFGDGTKAMAGGSVNHSLVAANVLAALHSKLRGKPCRAHGSDLKLVVEDGRVFYPDVLVDCGRPDGKALTAAEPTLVAEVLSPSTRGTDLASKLEDYKRVETLQYILILEQDQRRGRLWSRDGGAWFMTELNAPDAVIDLPLLDAAVRFDDVYEGVETT